MGSRAIARELGCARGVVSKWRVRFARERLAGLADAPRSGKPKTYGEDAGRRILALLDRPPPQGFARWTAPLLAKELGDVSEHHVWRFLRAQRIDLAGRKSWCLSTDPEFVAKAATIVGLYLDPPENAIVLAVDEKPAIQALERAQGYLKLPNGRSLHGQAHEYRSSDKQPALSCYAACRSVTLAGLECAWAWLFVTVRLTLAWCLLPQPASSAT